MVGVALSKARATSPMEAAVPWLSASPHQAKCSAIAKRGMLAPALDHLGAPQVCSLTQFYSVSSKSTSRVIDRHKEVAGRNERSLIRVIDLTPGISMLFP